MKLRGFHSKRMSSTATSVAADLLRAEERHQPDDEATEGRNDEDPEAEMVLCRRRRRAGEPPEEREVRDDADQPDERERDERADRTDDHGHRREEEDARVG